MVLNELNVFACLDFDKFPLELQSPKPLFSCYFWVKHKALFKLIRYTGNVIERQGDIRKKRTDVYKNQVGPAQLLVYMEKKVEKAWLTTKMLMKVGFDFCSELFNSRNWARINSN